MTEQWVSNQRFEIANIATSEFVKQIHVKMFNKTWRWAGQFRKTNKNIGVDWPLVSVELKILLDDVQYQDENNIYPKDELAARFHHRLVAIHPFPNGNGRHARMMADIMLIALGCSRFSWGSNSLAESSPVRKLYIEALREADRMNYEKLITFVRD